MNIVTFFKSLLPNFAKQTVLEDIRADRIILTTVVLPAYEDALRAFGSRKFVNESLQKDWEIYRRSVKGAFGSNTIMAIEKSLKPMLSKLDLIEELVEKDYTEDIEGTGITYYKAAVLQMLESIGFASDFAIKYLNYVYVIESAELNDSDEETKVIDELNAAIVPADVRFIHERFQDFCTVMDVLAKPTDKVKSEFEEIPDITVTAAGDKAVQATMGATKLDPFGHGFVPLVMNPIYHVRMQVAEWQHYRYEKAKQEKEALQLRKLRLERLEQGKHDPAIEKQIEYTQKRIEDLDAHIRKVEAQYGG